MLTPNGTGLVVINNLTNNVEYAQFGNNVDRRLKFSNFINQARNNAGHLINASDSSGTIAFATASVERWRISETGILQSNGAQTIQSSTGNLTIATAAGDGNILLSPNGTGNVGVGTTPSGAKLDVLGNFRVRRDINANQYLDITSGGGFVNILAYNGNSSSIFQELIFQSGNTTSTVERWKINSTGGFQSNGSQTIQTSTGNLILTSADNTGVVDIRRTDRALGAELRLTNSFNGLGWLAGDIVGTLNFYSPDTSTTQPIRSQIQAISTSGTTYPTSMNLTFSTANANTLTEGFRLTALSNLHIGPFTSDGGQKLQVTGTSLFTDTATFSVDAVVNGVNIGRGAGAISSNTRVGAGSLIANTTGTSNSAFGTSSGDSNTTGTDNTYIGAIAGQRNTTGSQNVFVGERAGRFIANGSTALTITNNSIFVGRDSRALADSQTNQIVIGHTAIGNGSNTVTIGNSSVTDNYFIGNIRGGAFIKSGGTSSQFLKADGSVDSTVYGTGTVTSVAALTIGTTGTNITSTVANGTTTPVITLNVPNASATNRGALTAADWTTFNGKQNALTLTTTGTSGAATLVGATLNIPQYQSVITNPVTGTGTAGQVAYWSSSSAITGESNLFWDATNDRLGIGRNNPSQKLDILASGTVYVNIENSGANIAAVVTKNTSKTFSTGLVTDYWEVNDATSGSNPRLIITSGGNVLINTVTDVTGANLNVNGNIRTAAPTGTAAENWRLGRAVLATSSIPEDRWIRVQLGTRVYDILAIDKGLA